MSETNEEQESGNVATADAANDAEEKIPFEVTNDEMRPDCIRAVTIDLSIEVYDKRLKTAFADLKKTIQLPGFRKGKAPEGLLKKRFGKDLEKETVQRIAETVFDDMREQLAANLASEAEMEDFNLDKDAKKLSIDYVMEIVPEVEPKDYKGQEVEVEYKEDEARSVDDYMEQIANEWSTFEDKDGAIEENDAVTLDTMVTNEKGHTIRADTGSDVHYRAMQQRLPEAVIQALIGKKVGDSVQLEVERERRDKNSAVISNKDSWDVTVKAVQVSKPAEITDEFVKENLQVEGGVEEYRKVLQKRIDADKDEQKRIASLKAVYDQLLEHNKFDVPQSLVYRQAEALAGEQARNMAMYGIDMSKLIKSYEQFRNSFLERADRMVRVGFLVSAIAKAEDIEVTDADVDAEIEKRAEEAGRKPLAIRAQLERAQKLDSLKEDLKLDKTADFILENSKLTYVEPKEQPAEEEAATAADDKAEEATDE
jgi:trigger factor